MAYLLDTNILARLANTADVQHAAAVEAIRQLSREGEVMHLTPQILIEFRSVGTRSLANNGLGLTGAEVEQFTETFESRFVLLPDVPEIFTAWKMLVATHQIIGKQVHDARLLAVCQTHGVSHLLTFNTAHFSRFSTAIPLVVAVSPLTLSMTSKPNSDTP